MKEVVLVYEENHGLICVAENMRAAYVNLIQGCWITAGMDICTKCEYIAEKGYQETWQTLAEIMGVENPTKQQILDFVMTVDANTFWEGCFYFNDSHPIADQQEIEWEVTVLPSGEECDPYTRKFDSMHDAFHFAAKIEAFSDCTDERVLDIRCGEHHYHYQGWRPGMEYNYVDACGDVVWSCSYTEWDH